MTEGDEALGQTPLQNEDVEAAQQPNLLNGVDSKELEGERGDEDGVEGHDDDRDDKKVRRRSRGVVIRTADPRLALCGLSGHLDGSSSY
jgi:hypothetical protein